LKKHSLRQSVNASSDRRAELTVETMTLNKLTPHPRNHRQHPAPGSAEWNTLKASIEHDYFDPIVWNRRNGMLVSGHLRVKVLAASGFDRADCVIVDYPEDVHIARMLAANKSIGSDDAAALKDLLEELDCGQKTDAGELLAELTGYSDAERERLATQFHVPPEVDQSGGKDTRTGRTGIAGGGQTMVVSVGMLNEVCPREMVEALAARIRARWNDLPITRFVEWANASLPDNV
jgi:hypothetical protein